MSTATVTVHQGESKNIQLTVTAGGLPLDLTAAVLYFTLKITAATANPAVLAKTSADAAEIEITDATAGKATIKILAADTDALSIQRYVYDVWVDYSASDRRVIIAASPFQVVQAVRDWTP